MSAYQEIEEWFSSQPKWLQEAARLIIDTGKISSDDESYLLKLCKDEALGVLVPIKGIKPGSISIGESEAACYLEAIQEVHGVNAIKQSQPLVFGSSEMNVVYGDNGTGKTGYIRLLKKASSSRFSEEILYNIYSEREEKGQHCEIVIRTNDESQTIPCNLVDASENAYLGKIDVFDLKAAIAYLSDGLTASYEPWVIGLLQRLVSISDRLRDLLNDEIQAIVIPTIEIPEDIQGSTKIRVLDEISKKTNVDSFAILDLDKHEKRIKEINELLSDSFSIKQDTIIRRKNDVQLLISRIETIRLWLSDSSISEINTLCDIWKAAHKSREEAAQAFAAEHADISLSSGTWRAMWDAVEKYATTKAESKGSFPYLGDDAICPFCEQPLQQGAKDRLKTIAEQVNSDLEQKEKDALAKYREVLSKAPVCVSVEELKMILGNLECFTDEEKQNLLRLWQQYNQLLDEAKKVPSRFQLPPFDSYYAKAVETKSGFEAELKKIDESLKDEKRSKLIAELLELKGEVFVHKCIPTVVQKISVLKQKSELETALKLVTTNKLSIKNRELADELVTAEYITRFNKELAALSTTGLKAELREQKAGKGKVPLKVTLVSHGNEIVNHLQVLSEGEQRVVALAVFLADVTGGAGSRPIVFDDPISSLDHIYERKIADRLANLSRDRQVIIFTHRLSLFAMIQNITKDLGIKATATCLNSWPQTTFKGNPSSDNSFVLDPKAILNRLKCERISKLKKYEQEGSSECQEVAFGICRQIRVCLERCVEKYLFNGAVERFCSDIQTQRLRKLKFLTSSDFDFIDEYMTKYSPYVHAVADEIPQQVPTASILEDDIEKILTWIEDIRKRIN